MTYENKGFIIARCDRCNCRNHDGLRPIVIFGEEWRVCSNCYEEVNKKYFVDGEWITGEEFQKYYERLMGKGDESREGGK